jgi:hypothetical protein
MARLLTILAIGAWFTAAVWGGLHGIFNHPDMPPVALGAFILVPITGFLLAYTLSAAFRTFAQHIDMRLLVGSHIWRFVGVGFVIGWLTGNLPAQFGVPEGLFDIIAAAGATILLVPLSRGEFPRRWLFVWNVFGVLDLISAITVGALYSNGTLGILSAGTVTTQVMTVFSGQPHPDLFCAALHPHTSPYFCEAEAGAQFAQRRRSRRTPFSAIHLSIARSRAVPEDLPFAQTAVE